MPLNPNMPRWIFASVSKFLSERRGDYTLWIDGQEPLDQETLPSWAEFYMTYDYTPIGRDFHQYNVDVLIGLVLKKDYQNSHQPISMKGFFESIVTSGPINVYKLGKNLFDDKSYVGCLQLREDVSRPVDGLNFGQIETDIRVIRATVEAFYQMTIDT